MGASGDRGQTDSKPAKLNNISAALADGTNGQNNSDYGLRRRSVISPRGTGTHVGEEHLRSFKKDDAAYIKQLEQSGIHPLAKNEVKSDINLIRGLAAAGMPEKKVRIPTVSEVMINDDLPTSRRDSKRKKATGSKPQNTNKKSSRQRSASSNETGFSSDNFRVPFEGTLRAKDVAEKKFQVCERQYQSVRHAYMRKLREIKEKQEAQLRVLDGLKTYLIDGEEELSKLTDATAIVHQAVVALQTERQRKSKNQASESEPKPEEEINSSSMDVEEEETPIDTILPKLEEWLQKESKELDPFEEHERNIHERLKTKKVDTLFGGGVVEKFRADGIAQVKLSFGTGFLAESAVLPPSLDLERETKKGSRSKQKRSSKPLSNQELTLFSPDTTGAPRGVRLNLSLVSDEPDFAVAPSKPLEPDQLHNDFIEFDHLDADEYNKLPQSWGGLHSAPWIGKRTPDGENMLLSRSELERWQEERMELLVARGDAIRLRFKCNKLRASAKVRDRVLASQRQMQETLVDRLGAARQELHSLRAQCAHLLAEKEDQGEKKRKTRTDDEHCGGPVHKKKDDDEDDSMGGDGAPERRSAGPRRSSSTRARSSSNASGTMNGESSGSQGKRKRAISGQEHQTDSAICGQKVKGMYARVHASCEAIGAC